MDRSRLLGSTDRECLVSPFIALDRRDNENHYPQELSHYVSDHVFLTDLWHGDDFHNAPEELLQKSTWRVKERMKTAGVALVLCLNIGTDPPDIVKPIPCARMECWHEPQTTAKQKSLETIGINLQRQYEKWQSRAKYKQCLDPTSDDLRKVCMNLRKGVKNERLLLHYNGHGVPRPTKNGELWAFGKNYTHYLPVTILELRSWLGDPCIFVLDCSSAGVLLPFFVDYPINNPNSSNAMDELLGQAGCVTPSSSRSFRPSSVSSHSSYDGPAIVLAACRAQETLPLNPLYPADIFTSCLTTPIPMFLRWLIIQNPHTMGNVPLEMAEHLPGKDGDRKSPRGELNWIFTSITDTIAWHTLPSTGFQKLFRHDLLVASLFRNFLLSKRIMKSFGCNPQSLPQLPDSASHSLWQTLDLEAEACVLHVLNLQKGTPMVEPFNNLGVVGNPVLPPTTAVVAVPAVAAPAVTGPTSLMGPVGMPGSTTAPSAAATAAGGESESSVPNLNSSFFTEHLRAFEIWLDFESSKAETPPYLPIVLQVLLSPTHRLRALQLLQRYLARKAHAVNLALLVGIFPYILRLLTSPPGEIRQVLVCIWAHILGLDPSCRVELIREKSQVYFIQYLTTRDVPPNHRCMAAFALAEICNGFQEGRQTCLQQGLHRSCSTILAFDSVTSSPELKKWICLCLYKLCEDFPWAKYLCLTETGHPQLYPLLIDDDPNVRAAAVLALGELFGAHEIAGNPQALAVASNTPSPRNSGLSGAQMATPVGMGNLGKFASPASTGFGKTENAKQIPSEQCRQLLETELLLAIQILDNCTDGSVIVRKEAVLALAKLFSFSTHLESLRIVVSEVREYSKINSGKKDGRAAPIALPGNSKSLLTSHESWSVNQFQLEAIVQKLKKHLDDSGFDRMSADSRSDDALTSSMSMSSGYVHLWLALQEVHAKDPHPQVTRTTAALTGRILREVEMEDLRLSMMALNADEEMRSYLSDSLDQTASGSSELEDWGVSAEDITRMSGGVALPLPSPAAAAIANPAAFPSPGRPPSGRLSSQFSHFASGLQSLPSAAPPPSPSKARTSTTPNPLNLRTQLNINTKHGLQTPSLESLNRPSSLRLPEMPTIERTPEQREQDDSISKALTSHFYAWHRKLFLVPDPGYSPYDDPLSCEGQNRVYRNRKLSELVEARAKIRNMYRNLDVKVDGVMEQKTREDFNPRASLISSLPPAATNFEEKCYIELDSGQNTAQVMFHAFHDILALSDGSCVSIWDIRNAERLVNVNNNAPNPSASQVASGRHNLGWDDSFAGRKSARITSMNWINESYDALLMVGSDDGAIKIWKDLADSEIVEAGDSSDKLNGLPPKSSAASGSSGKSKKTTPYVAPKTSIGVTLGSSFIALPDVDRSPQGSGLVHSWLQHSGTLVAGGNSRTIRVWDVNREKCARTFVTGLETCTTAVAAYAVDWKLSLSFPLSYSANLDNKRGADQSQSNISEAVPLSWSFAGFADGSVGIFDQRVATNGGRVHLSREHASWVNTVHLRADIPQVISGSVKGLVKFSDLRTMRVLKQIEVQKSAMTAMAVHTCAPIIAAGSQAQFIKFLTYDGDQIGNVIKYHEGFLGQRIGPVTALAFHPSKLLLAAGAQDNILAICGVVDN